MVAPHVSRAAALIKQANLNFTPAEIKKIIVGTVTRSGLKFDCL